MSGFEIVGAVAVGCQFVEQLVTVGKLIFSVYNQLQDGPAQILQRLQELQTFSDIVKQVKSTESLQTDIAKDIFLRCDKHTSQLIAIFESISSATSSASLSHRTWKAIVGVAKEDDILKIFLTLEREKSALQLHIDALNTYVLQDPLDLIALTKTQRSPIYQIHTSIGAGVYPRENRPYQTRHLSPQL